MRPGSHLDLLQANAGTRRLRLRLREQLLRERQVVVRKLLPHPLLLLWCLLLLLLGWWRVLKWLLLRARLPLVHGQPAVPAGPALHAWHLDGIAAIDAGHVTLGVNQAVRQPWQLLQLPVQCFSSDLYLHAI